MLHLFRKKISTTSLNFGARRGGVKPSMIVLHYTGMESAETALERLCDPASEVSAHYLIEENGCLHTLVDEEKRAWHAGKAYWAGEDDINSASIGIELVNPGHEFGYAPFPDKQLAQLIVLCKTIREKWGMSAGAVLGHSDVAPGRKIDPGHLFPWEKMAAEGIGLWPRPTEMDYQAAEDIILNQDAFQELLCGFGYDSKVEFDVLAREFMRHYQPEKFTRWDGTPTPDITTAARLLALAA